MRGFPDVDRTGTARGCFNPISDGDGRLPGRLSRPCGFEAILPSPTVFRLPLTELTLFETDLARGWLLWSFTRGLMPSGGKLEEHLPRGRDRSVTGPCVFSQSLSCDNLRILDSVSFKRPSATESLLILGTLVFKLLIPVRASYTRFLMPPASCRGLLTCSVFVP